MANDEHLKILKKGVDAWNQWRKDHPDIRPNLRGADLTEADLSEADLSKTDLSNADLIRANLVHANLRGAGLQRADLSGANLFKVNLLEADLSEAHLVKADLERANLTEANLRGADLSGADLRGADLAAVRVRGADLGGAKVFRTTFRNVDLSEVKGLEQVEHLGPSTVGIDTVYRSRGKIPEVFLRGAGVPENFIEYMHSLVGPAFHYYSCFISYSSKDQEFADRLHADLQSKGVRCWLATEDLKIGDKFRQRIDEAIRLHDKLLVVLSQNSVNSTWVESEVETAFEKERTGEKEKPVLFPIRLDDAVMKAKQAWAGDIRRTRHIGDFTKWRDHDSYKGAFERLLRDLRGEKEKEAVAE